MNIFLEGSEHVALSLLEENSALITSVQVLTYRGIPSEDLPGRVGGFCAALRCLMCPRGQPFSE